MFIYKLINQTLLASGVSLYCLLTTTQTQAQVSSDETVSTEVNTTDNQNFTITGGSQAGNNLFQSFEDFSVPQNGSASFENSANIQNIIGRVTGSSVSEIDGLIQAQDDANLLLINPNGIIFGANARLDIGGSFLATTADSMQFSDGSQFSATDSQTKPLLTITAPVGLQFGEQPGTIINRSVEFDSEENPIDGLIVDPGQTLALIGGNLEVDNGVLFAPGGRIELGSVASFAVVDLASLNDGWTFGYEQVQNFQNIQLSQAYIDTSDFYGNLPSGNIQLRSREITVNQSQLGGINFTANPGEILSIKATEFLAITNNSLLTNSTVSTGTAGDIEIETGRLIINTSTITTEAQGRGGRGGNITIDAFESIEIDGKGKFAELITKTTSTAGDSGNINITTENFILRDGGQISTSTDGESNGGNITVSASKSIEISGQGESNDEGIRQSGLLAQTENPESIDFAVTGDGGNININTGNLQVSDGGTISVGAVDDSQGQAGNLDINAQNITLDQGSLNAETASGNGGDIILNNLDLLQLSNQSKISTTAGTSQSGGDGGNININAPDGFIVANPYENSDITANAFTGSGGQVKINAAGIYGITERKDLTEFSDITASSEQGVEGDVNINRLEVEPERGLIEIPTQPIPTEVAQVCTADLARNKSQFIVTGRGGFASSPREELNPDAVQVDWVTFDGETTTDSSTLPEFAYPQPTSIVEATSWKVNDRGNVVLIANKSHNNPESFWQSPSSCKI
ncbi:MAG: filamentous hemagglutinin N-terminal domain-containing protein [Waterburya sp.]